MDPTLVNFCFHYLHPFGLLFMLTARSPATLLGDLSGMLQCEQFSQVSTPGTSSSINGLCPQMETDAWKYIAQILCQEDIVAQRIWMSVGWENLHRIQVSSKTIVTINSSQEIMIRIKSSQQQENVIATSNPKDGWISVQEDEAPSDDPTSEVIMENEAENFYRGRSQEFERKWGDWRSWKRWAW